MNELITDITSKEEFDGIVEKEKRPILIDLWAKWCGPCKMFAPVLHSFAETMGDKIRVLKIDVDECEELAALLSVNVIPTVLVVKDGDLKEKSVGLCTEKDLSNMLIKYL